MAGCHSVLIPSVERKHSSGHVTHFQGTHNHRVFITNDADVLNRNWGRIRLNRYTFTLVMPFSDHKDSTQLAVV